MPKDDPDRNLLLKCLFPQTEDAWEQFVRAYSRLIWSAIHRTFKASSFTYSPEDVEDIYSSLFVSLLEDDFRKLRQYQARNACSLSTWLTVVTVRKTIDHMRRQRTRPRTMAFPDDASIAETIADNAENIEQALMHAQKNESLARSINSLTSGDRQVYDLLYQRGLTPEAAARDMGTSSAAIYTRKHRLIEKLKKSMEKAQEISFPSV